ncbi:MAG: MFS transporter, partial [Xanthobacteraceae bacterium]|nr:MFS transporter [Xanthobacteraceae bacterium]
AVLMDQAVRYVKPGGHIAYVTCSVLEAENGAQMRAFLARTPGFAAVPAAETALALGERGVILKAAALASPEGILLTPRRTETDGFYTALLARST